MSPSTWAWPTWRRGKNGLPRHCASSGQGLARAKLADDPDLLLALIDNQLTAGDIKGG